MPPIWPFKKKKEMEHEIDEAPPAPVVYKRGEDPNARAAVETDAGAYKDALALFGDGSSEVNPATRRCKICELDLANRRIDVHQAVLTLK